MKRRWRSGNRVELLENGEEFYPRVFRAIDNARYEVLLETFILFDDDVGRRLAEVLKDAARRGVRVELTVDAWGSKELGAEFLAELTAAGVCLHLFEDTRVRWLQRIDWFRRLHRKLLVVDGRCAFVGGINFSQDHLKDGGCGREAKQDYAVQVEGPLVADIHRFAIGAIRSVHRRDRRLPAIPPDVLEGCAEPAGDVVATFVSRDNLPGRRTAIERYYRMIIRRSTTRLVIANAYFFPGYRLLREIRRAARRGVDVRLITQAEPDIPISRFAGRLLYDYLLEAGAHIYEYDERQFHGKVAIVDDEWATVGSSNLDPLSLWFNLEANVVVRNQPFNRAVRERLDRLMAHHCREITPADTRRWIFWRPVVGFFAFHFLRHFPRFAGLLPAHRPRITRVRSPDDEQGRGAAW